MRTLAKVFIILIATLWPLSTWAGPLCTDPFGWDILTERPLYKGDYEIVTPESDVQVVALSELEMIRLGLEGHFEPIEEDPRLQEEVARLIGNFNRDGVRGVLGFNDKAVRINGPALFVLAKDAVTDGDRYFQFKNFYMVAAQGDVEIEAEWILQSPMIAQTSSFGSNACHCDQDELVCKPPEGGGDGGGGCEPERCFDFDPQLIELSEFSGPAHQMVVDECAGNTRYIDAFGNELHGTLGFEPWFEQIQAGPALDLGACDICKVSMPICDDYRPPTIENVTPASDECGMGGSKVAVSLICKQALPEPGSGFCGPFWNVPAGAGPNCVDGGGVGGLLNPGGGVSPAFPADLRGCSSPTFNDYCRMVEGGDEGPCFETQTAKFELRDALATCSEGHTPEGDFECVGTNGACKITGDGIKFCTSCTGEQCTEWIERQSGWGDPRRFSDSETTDDKDDEKAEGQPTKDREKGVCGDQGACQFLFVEPEVEPANQETSEAGVPEGSPETEVDPNQPKGHGRGAVEATHMEDKTIAESITPAKKADPVVIQTGELIMHPVDISLSGPVIPFEFQRSYTSQSDFQGVLGSNWTHNYETRLELIRPGKAPMWASPYCGAFWPHATCLIRHHEHSQQLYVYDPVSQRYVPHLGSATSHVVDKGPEGFVLFERDGATETFNAFGYLTGRKDRFGNGVEVTLELSPLGILHRRYCARRGNDNARDVFDLDPLVCSYLSYALGLQPAELLARAGWTPDSPLVLPPDEASTEVSAGTGTRWGSWEYISASPNVGPPFTYMKDVLYSDFVRRSNLLLQLMLELGYMVKPAMGPAQYRVQKVRELRHNRTLHFHYHNPELNTSVVENTNYGLLKKVTVNSVSGWGVEFEYFRPDYGIEFNEYFLTRAKKIYQNANDVDNSFLIAHASAQTPLDQQYTYVDEPGHWSKYDGRFFEYFEDMAGCAVINQVMCMGLPRSITDGNPCHLTHQEKMRYLGRISDNIIKVERAGQVELTSIYENDMDEDNFDRVVWQNYGGRLDGVFTLDYVVAGPTGPGSKATPGGEKVSTSPLVDNALKGAFPLESAPSELTETPATRIEACGDPGTVSDALCERLEQPVDHGGIVATNPGTCGANHRHETAPGTIGKECQFDTDKHTVLPGFKHEFDYFKVSESCEPGDERCVAPLPSQPEVWRTYLTCDQLAAQHLYDVRSSGTVGGSKIDANGDRVEDWEGVEEKRALIETDLRRICTWVKATNREGEVTLYGLNFRAQALVEATRMGDAYHLVQRVFNADGQIAKEWDPRTLQTALSNTAYTQYEYDEITPESQNGWGKRWPSPWATRHNLLRSEYVPASPVYEHDSTQSSTAVYQRYLWEPLFNQVRYIEYGKVINGQDVPISSQRRVYDYQEFATLPEGLHSTQTPTDPFIKTLVRQIALGKHWPDEVDQNQHFLDNRAIEVFDGVETTSVPLITGFFFQGIPFVGEDINQDGVVATSGVARGLPIVVIEEDHTQTGQDDAIQSTALSWTINGQLAGVTDPTGVSTRLEYFPRDYQSWRGTTRPDAQTVSTGNTGKLARVFSDRAIAEWPQEELPPENCKTLTGPYAFLPSCAGGIMNMLDSLNLPTEVKDRITGYGVEEDLTEFRYNAQGHVHRVWANGREEVHWNDADGRLVRLEEGDRVTQLRYTPEAWVNDKRVLENGNLVSHETFAHDRAGNVIGHCVSRTGTSCLTAFSSSFAIGDPSPSGTSRTLFAYDKEDRLSHTSDPLGVVTFSERDALGRVIREYTPDCIGSQCSDDSREVRYEYDLMGRVTAQHYGSETVVQQMGGGSESFAYDGYGRLVTHVDRRLNTWQMAWNKADQLRAKMIYGLAFPAPLLGTEARTWTYGPFGRVEKEVVDPHGAALTTKYYYSRGNVPYKTKADGYAPVYASTDASGRPIVSVDQTEVRVWTYSLDGLEGTETSVALDENGLPDTSVTKRTVVDRHGMPLISEQINGLNELRRWTFARSYQTNGWKFDQVDPAGRTTSSFTDFAGFKIQDEVATPQGTEITQFTVNARGETREILDPSGGLTKQEFNAFGDRIHLEKPSPTNDDIHQYSFDAYGRLNSWKRHREEVVWTFDSRGDLHQELVINAAGTEVLNAYDWDDAGRQTSSTAFNPQVRDSLGLSVQDARVSVVSNWDDAGRLTLEEMTVGSTSQLLFNDWTLNAQGNWEVHTEQTGLGNFSRTTTLDSAGRRVMDQTAFAFPSSNIAYSWAGRRMTQRVHNGNVSFDTGFNGFGERITHTGTGPNGVFHTEILERDVLGRVRSQTHGSQAWNGQERWQGYEYDARHALSTSWEAWAPTNTAPSVGSHDTATNLSVASAAGGLGATASARERAPTLGSLQKIVQGAQDVWEAQRTAAGHRLSEISDSNATWMIEHDPLGRVTAALDKEYEYDPLGKLVLARDTNGDLLESYLMTADGRIAQIQRHEAQGYTASMLAYDGAQMTASFTEASGMWTQDWQAVWGPGQDQLLEFHDFHTGKTFAVAQDHRNNVVALLDDATGTLDRVMHYTPEGLSTHYDDAGQVLCDEEASLIVTCTELNMPFGFNGMWRSNTTGLSHMRNRWYSPQLGQFMSHDPLEYIDSYDLYAFAKLDPINFWDPWGLSGGSLAAAQAGAKVGQKKKETPAIPDDDDDDPKLDPIDRVNPAEKSMIYFYLAFKADQRQRDDYWTENQDEKFGDLMPEGTRYECTAVCSLGLVVGIFSSVAETIGIATAGAALGVAGGKAAAKRIKPTRVKPCSFVEDTPVLMCDGNLKSIVDVEIGDSVLARSKLTGEIECREVMNLSEPAERSIILVTLESMDSTSEVIATTENHPFFVEGRGWTRVDDLVPGDLVPSATNGLLTVSALEWTDRMEIVYNFGVDEYHTYFVGEVGAWVHNCYTPKGPLVGKRVGHTYSKHGRHNTKELTLQAKNSGQPQGQWLDEEASEKLIADNLHRLSNGTTEIPIPSGVGRVIMDDGSFRAATKARLVPSGNGVKTAYPILD